MKKEIKRYEVLQSLTEDGIKSIGVSLWMRKRFKWIIAMLIIFLVVAGFTANVDSEILKWGMVFAICVFGIWYVWKILAEGKKFFNKVKNKPEPIDLREIK